MIIFLLLFLLLIPRPGLADDDRQLLDRVVAVVNEEPITQSELDVLLRPVYEQYKNEYSEEKVARMMNDARQKLLNQLIEDKLVFQQAKTQKLEVDETEIEKQMDQFRKHFKSDAEMDDAIKKEGLTLNEMRERLRRQWLVRRLQDQEIRSKVVVSPLEVEDYYNTHMQEFSSQDKIKVRSITIKKNAEAREKGLTDEAAKNKIEELRKKILSGEDFGVLARQNSEDIHSKQDGLGDWIEVGTMIPEIDQKIFKMTAGEVSEVIETPMGYHLFRVEEKQPGKKKTLEEARDDIFARLYQGKALKRFQEWMEELKRNAYISVR